MNISIRNHIKNNFKQTTYEELKSSIEGNIKNKEEYGLPGLGVFFEVLWTGCDQNFQDEIIKILENNLK